LSNVGNTLYGSRRVGASTPVIFAIGQAGPLLHLTRARNGGSPKRSRRRRL